MIDAKVLLKNKADRHLNVFWQYDGRPWLENNITKALINTFDSLDETSKKVFVNKLFGIILPETNLSYEIYLQKSPVNEQIKAIEDNNRLLFAFSPTGKAWGNNGIDSGDNIRLENSIRESLRMEFPDKKEKDIDALVCKQVEEVKKNINDKGDSIPDAWIVILENGNPLYCVAMENKLYDLDPYQLNNHCQKSLFMKENHIKYAKYDDIFNVLDGLNGYLVDEFLRYMYFLNYWDVKNLAQLKGIDEESVKVYAQRRCESLLAEISNKAVSWHRNWMYKFNTNNEFNRMVGMKYDSESRCFQIPLYFGSTQNSASEMYYYFASLELNGKLSKKFKYYNSFHFQYIMCGNIEGTYYKDDNFDIYKYIEFWIQNAGLLRQMDKTARAELLNKMLTNNIIPIPEYEKLLEFSNHYEKKLNVCPEFGVELSWSLEEAQELDEKGMFVSAIKERINEVYRQFGMEEEYI